MNKKFINGFLLASLVVGSGGILSSCKDYDDDIDQLRQEVAVNKSAIDDINSKIAAGAILESVTPNATNTGIIVTVSKNGTQQTYEIKNGVNGTNADVWTIAPGSKGEYTWFKNDVDQGIAAQGPKGEQGIQGNPGTPGTPGTPGAAGAPGNYWAPNAEGTELVEHVWNAETKKYEPTTNTVKIAITVPAGETPDITATVTDGYVYLTGVQTGTDGEGKPVYGNVAISRSGLLTGLGFIPALYLDGVEGTRFGYVSEKYLSKVTTTTGGDMTIITPDNTTAKVAYTIPAGTVWSYTIGSTAYQLSENAVANFNLNPDNANLDGVQFSFLPIANIETVSASRAAAPSLVVKKTENANGKLTVTYNVENPAAMAYTANGKNTLPVTALNADLKATANANTAGVTGAVTSDYFSLVMSQVKFDAISYTDAFSKSTDLHLATTGKTAIEKTEGMIIPVKYTQDPKFTFADKLMVCYKQADFGKDLDNAPVKRENLAEFLAKWNLSVNYEMMTYKVGDSKTSDSEFAVVNPTTGEVTLRYLKSENPNVWVDCSGADDNKGSRSAIGRHPVVRITILNGTDVVLAGYAMIEITDDVPESPLNNEGKTLASGTFPYLCTIATNNTVTSTWQTTTSLVLAELGMSESEFVESYEVDGDPATGPVYVSPKKGTFNKLATNKYGNLAYNPDSQVGPTNGFLVWTYSQPSAATIIADSAATRHVTLYRKFTNKKNKNDNLYLGVTVSIAQAPIISYGTLDPYQVVAGTTNQVGMGVLAANNSQSKPVSYFESALASYYVGGNIAANYVTQKFDALKAGYPALVDMITTYSYSFKTVDNAQMSGLSVSPDGLSLLKNSETVATIDPSNGIVAYATTATAKNLLNGVGVADQSKDSYVYAWVKINSQYCNNKAATHAVKLNFQDQENDEVRINFRRPVTVTGANGYNVIANGIVANREMLGNFFTMKDYFGWPLFVKNTSGLYVDYFGEGEYKGTTGLFDYYTIQEIQINLSQASSGAVDFAAELKAGVTNISLSKVAGVYSVKPVSPATKLGVEALNNVEVVIDYKNNLLEKDLPVTIPVTVKYYWGTQTVNANVTIKPNRKN